jgi:putative restriction endonuclease
MGFGIFMHKADSIYDDRPAEWYQFPKPYLSRAMQFVGDWIIYLEPRKVKKSRGYFAMARVAEIVPDPSVPGRYRALIEPGSYLGFPNPVSFTVDDGLVERGLLNENARISGRAQAAVRPLLDSDFRRILSRGLAEFETILPRIGDVTPFASLGFDEGLQEPFAFEVERHRVEAMVSRSVRDRVFRKVVLRAYDARCGVTGLKLINGGGRAEVDAAHIRPVEQNGPDIVNNGIALSGTAHWMFDRGLIGIEDDLQIVVSRQVNDRDGVMSLINPTGKLIGPLLGRDRPHPAFLKWHRDNIFKT